MQAHEAFRRLSNIHLISEKKLQREPKAAAILAHSSGLSDAARSAAEFREAINTRTTFSALFFFRIPSLIRKKN